jgi:hypothetical protein
VSGPRSPQEVLGGLDAMLAVLQVALAQWDGRDDTRAQPAVTEAGNTAMGAIDQMLADLHKLRARLVSERRVSQLASAARAGALLSHNAVSKCPPRGEMRQADETANPHPACGSGGAP